jgi:hypothetical protein
MKIEYRGRWIEVLLVVSRGRVALADPLAGYRPGGRGDHELRRALWRSSVEMIKREPVERV